MINLFTYNLVSVLQSPKLSIITYYANRKYSDFIISCTSSHHKFRVHLLLFSLKIILLVFMVPLISIIFLNCFCPIINGQDDVIKIIKNEGYAAELHSVITDDGYILNVHRIPTIKSTHKIALIMHGLQISSFAYVFAGRECSLALQLSDNGYDVWIGNARGTEFSKKHQRLNSKSKEFWDFSFHEIGKYDVAAIIDHILLTTNQTAIHYVGNSQGTTAVLVLLCLKPNYNEKLLTLHLMTPVVLIKNSFAPLRYLGTYVAPLADEVDGVFDVLDISKEVFTVNDDTRKLLANMCNLKSITYGICKNYFFTIAGKSPNQWNDKLFVNTTKLFEHIPNSVSLRQILHYVQLYTKGRFAHFDYKNNKNLLLYNRSEPPEYNLKNIRTKIHFIYGTNDNVVNYKDVEILIEYFKSMVIGIDKLIGWNHADFLVAKDVKKMVNQKILKLMNQYSASGLD